MFFGFIPLDSIANISFLYKGHLMYETSLYHQSILGDRGFALVVIPFHRWLIFECLKFVEVWLELEIALRNNSFALDAISSSGSFVTLFARNPSKGSHPPPHESLPTDQDSH